MAATKELIKRIRLTSSAASISFYNIPQGFDDLELVVSGRSSRSANDDGMLIQFNGSSTSFSARELRGTGSAASSNSLVAGFAGFIDGNTATSNTFGNTAIYIPNYTSANYKSFSIDAVMENNGTAALQGLIAGLWSNTTAITSLTITLDVGPSFLAYTSAALYGYKGGSDGTTTVS